ncbi:MAG TPA: PilT/PilU family type 4a pilus ATPase [Armatimonadaceae bacterium]|nr:PilT/PilU family type 4a pilus ATPase [Armatimonadaceae bacterium]
MKSIHDLLEVAMQSRASDLILKADAAPALRVDGRIQSRPDLGPISYSEMHELAMSILYSATRDALIRHGSAAVDEGEIGAANAEQQMQRLLTQEEVDAVFTVSGLVRVRATLFLQRGAIGASLRIIPLRPYSIEALLLPKVLKDIAVQPTGLILITGPTGSGKSTTLASLVDHIAEHRRANIITIEDPIEYVFEDKNSVISQREVGADTRSFGAALHSVMRQTPDVIVIGEMRDVDTMRVALTAAEIGHLVISTVHTMSAVGTVDRILNAFPPHERDQVRAQLANTLTGVISQRLILRASGVGRVPAVEVMTGSPTIKKQIEEGESLSDIYGSIREGSHFGMNTLNQALQQLHASRVITADEAYAATNNLPELRQMLRSSRS